MESTAPLREHVTMTLAPAGIRDRMRWKMVVDFPVPGGPWISSTLRASAAMACSWHTLSGLAAVESRVFSSACAGTGAKWPGADVVGSRMQRRIGVPGSRSCHASCCCSWSQ